MENLDYSILNELKDKQEFVKSINEVLIKTGMPALKSVSLEVYVKESSNGCGVNILEFIVFNYRGGAFGVLDASCNSLGEVFRTIGDGLYGNTYDLKDYYEQVKKYYEKLNL